MVAVLMVVLATLAGTTAVHAQSGAATTVLIQFQPDASAEDRAAHIAALGGEEVAWLAPIHVAEVRIAQATQQAVAAMTLSVDTTPAVVFSEVDFAVSAAATIPNDPSFNDPAMRYALDQVQGPAAWDITLGSAAVVIAVVDSGVKLDHPAFAGRLVAGYDFVNQDALADDDAGHGTHVAGIIAAAANDGQGMAGLCPRCRIMPVKVLNAHSVGTWSHLAQGILYAVDHGAQVINLSLGATVPSQTLQAAIDYALVHGAIVVAAAGNHGSDEFYYPAALDGVIAVAATNALGGRWERSAYGPFIDLAAPGDLVYSTYHDLGNFAGGYTYMSGTSMAAPFVSALAGLVLGLAPTLDRDAVFEALRLGADDLGAPGWDPYFGHGRVNAPATLLAPLPALREALAKTSHAQLDRHLFLPGILSR